MIKKTPDSLAGFHMHNPDLKAHIIIARVISILENSERADAATIFKNISNILGEAESTHVLRLICQVLHVDYLSLLKTMQDIAKRYISPRLILHIAIFQISYILHELEADPGTAADLLNELKHIFTIDDPVIWLKRILSITEKERLHYSQAKEDLLHGLDILNVDTAEERKLKERRLNPLPHLNEN